MSLSSLAHCRYSTRNRAKPGAPMTWKPPDPTTKPPRQLAPATLAPLPLTVVGRDINAQGAPIYITPEGVEYVERLSAIGMSDTSIARAFRVSRSTFRECKRRQAEVAEALAAGRAGLHGELTNHLLTAARQGEWQASAVLYKLRFGGDGSPVNSAQGDDEPEGGAREVDWSKVPLEERSFLLLALQRINELQSGQPKLSAHDRAVLAHHTCLHLTPHERRQLVGGDPTEPYAWVKRLTHEERSHIRSLAKGPNAKLVLAGLDELALAAEEPIAAAAEPIPGAETHDYESLRLVAGVKEEP